MGFKIGIGGKVGPVRAGVSTRGIGAGVGPVSAGASFKPRRSSSSSSSDSMGFWGVAIIGVLCFALAAWPYWLFTFIAVKLFDAGRHSTARTLTGWIPEGLWLALVLLVGIGLLIDHLAAHKSAEGAQG